MPRKITTWAGLVVILLAGAFSSISLFQSRSKFLATGTKYKIATFGAFAAILVAVAAMFLWYYLNEKMKSGSRVSDEPVQQNASNAEKDASNTRKTNDTSSR